jgi:molybdenum cofactor biosynthesis enzyme MoaA
MVRKAYDFANILFAGPCNQRCPYCIGQQVEPALNQYNLDAFPLRNLDAFVALLRRHAVRQLIFTATITDPQLYHHEVRLIRWLREQLPRVQLSLHTNGQLALSKMDVFNLYDRATVSFPSFDPKTFEKMTGTQRMPDLAAIVRAAHIPVKVSCVLDEHNVSQVSEFLARCHEVGVRRLVFRRLYGDTRQWNVLSNLTPVRFYRHNPIYDYYDMEVTYWDFDRTTSTSLNLFSNGRISTEYHLIRHNPPSPSVLLTQSSGHAIIKPRLPRLARVRWIECLIWSLRSLSR